MSNAGSSAMATLLNHPRQGHLHALSRGCKLLALIALLAVQALAQGATPPLTTINFENVSGPSVFGSASPPLTINGATFSGGQVLTNATYLPADPTSVYGTSYFCTGCSDTITIDFTNKASNFSMLLLNGLDYTVTYTVEDDQGGQQQFTLVANDSSGSATVTLPESGIRQVVISADPSTWDFEIDNVQFSASTASLIDPVASGFLVQYAKGATISTDTNLLASGGTLVQGASADGVTELLIRIPASNAGDSYTLTLQDENGDSSSTGAIGGLFSLGSPPANAALTLTTAAVDTPSGPMVFAGYIVPVNFSRGSSDDSLANRMVNLQIAATSQTTAAIDIVRPPVILIHGLWGEATDWSGFSPLVGGSQNPFTTSTVDYSGYVSGITATTPSYSFVSNSSIRANSLGFNYNASGLVTQIRGLIASYAKSANVAAVQADVVGHSMGGDISRDFATLSQFSRGDNYGQGLIDKLITIGTPHYGSPLATDLLNGSNNCSAGTMATFGMPSFTSVVLNGATISGAVNDLSGTGDGSNLSAALTTLKNTALPFPMAYIAATSSSNNLTGLGKSGSASWWLSKVCSSDPIAKALTPTGWLSLFNNAASDSVVPETSQLNGSSNGAGGPFTGIIHSDGLTSLNFSPPGELDSASNIAPEVVTLLNEAKTGQDYQVYGGSQ